jgi:hypothetical protein
MLHGTTGSPISFENLQAPVGLVVGFHLVPIYTNRFPGERLQEK